MSYKEIKKKAHLIDKFIEVNKKSFMFPMKDIDAIIRYLFPGCYIRSKGWFKTVFKVCTKGSPVVLKIGKKNSIKDDIRAYKSMPHRVRKKYFAKIYWHTKYTLLQEYGESADPTKRQVENLRKISLKYGLGDIKKQNIRSFDGRLKIVDTKIIVPGDDRINFIKEFIRNNFS